MNRLQENEVWKLQGLTRCGPGTVPEIVPRCWTQLFLGHMPLKSLAPVRPGEIPSAASERCLQWFRHSLLQRSETLAGDAVRAFKQAWLPITEEGRIKVCAAAAPQHLCLAEVGFVFTLHCAETPSG